MNIHKADKLEWELIPSKATPEHGDPYWVIQYWNAVKDRDGNYISYAPGALVGGCDSDDREMEIVVASCSLYSLAHQDNFKSRALRFKFKRQAEKAIKQAMDDVHWYRKHGVAQVQATLTLNMLMTPDAMHVCYIHDGVRNMQCKLIGKHGLECHVLGERLNARKQFKHMTIQPALGNCPLLHNERSIRGEYA